MLNTTTVQIPAQTLTVQTEPVTLREAFTHSTPTGEYGAVLPLDTERVLRGNDGDLYDAFYNYLLNNLVEDCDAYLMTSSVIAVSPDGATMYLHVTTNLAEYAAAEPEAFDEAGISAAEIATKWPTGA